MIPYLAASDCACASDDGIDADIIDVIGVPPILGIAGIDPDRIIEVIDIEPDRIIDGIDIEPDIIDDIIDGIIDADIIPVEMLGTIDFTAANIDDGEADEDTIGATTF